MKKNNLLPDIFPGDPDNSYKLPDSEGSLSKRLQKTIKNLRNTKSEITAIEKGVQVLEERALLAENLLAISNEQIQAVLSFSKSISGKKDWLRFWLGIVIPLLLSIIVDIIIAVVIR